MATFEAKVYRLKIEEHPNADALELAVVGDYRSIVRKGQFKTGDLGVYIPEAAVLPEWLIQELGLEGKLAGKDKNRVKAVKLRGILSQGLIYPMTYVDGETDERRNMHADAFPSQVGKDYTEALGITKYEPPIPIHMAGEVFNAHGMTLKYDIENFKRYPDVLLEGEDVIMTEKLHGTWCCFGYHPDHKDSHIITSKGLSGQGLAFKVNEANANNLYLRALAGTDTDGCGTVLDRAHDFFGYDQAFYILGEVFGKGVQDLTYGTEKPQFRVFDIYVGNPGEGQDRYINAEQLQAFCTALNVQTVPIVYAGPFSKEVMEKMTNGYETVSGNEANIREGVVIKPAKERYDNELGRVVLKSVSEAYLLRKGNVTEFN
jgi:RNA ligase (TIGR02306 family)